MPDLDLGPVVGPGVAPGGSTGSILSKASAADYDTEWKTLSEIGQKLMELSNPIGEVLNTPESHRMVFRGKNLGTALTAEQKANIQNGTFKDLWLGDYWVIGGQNWRIADMDYWYNQGDTAFTVHHLVIMPDRTLYSAKMNETNTTEGGYAGSDMRMANLAAAKTTIQNAFGSAVLTHREFLVNAVTNGYPSSSAWYNSDVELPNEIMMYGSYIHAPANDGSDAPRRDTISKTQLALMQTAPKFINPNRQTQWLRDVISSARFATVDGTGSASFYYASGPLGVRPVFPIG